MFILIKWFQPIGFGNFQIHDATSNILSRDQGIKIILRRKSDPDRNCFLITKVNICEGTNIFNKLVLCISIHLILSIFFDAINVTEIF